MEINYNKIDDICEIILIGRLDGMTSEDVKKQVIPQIESGENKKIILNMGECEYVSSAGLRILMIIAKTVKQLEGIVVISNTSEEVSDVIKMTGFGNIFKSFPSVEGAVKYIQEGE